MKVHFTRLIFLCCTTIFYFPLMSQEHVLLSIKNENDPLHVENLKSTIGPDIKHVSIENESDTDTEIVYDFVPVTGMELAFSMNTFTQHPFQPTIGYGVVFGYWFALTEKRHYAGVDFSYEQYRYIYTHPSTGAETVNTHNLYTIPAYYGFNVTTWPAKLSVEVGANVNILKNSQGIINAPNNENAVLRLSNENYFINNIGTNFTARLKFEYMVFTEVNAFVRAGTIVNHKNWYIKDSFEIKPILFTFDIGMSKTFE